MHSSGCHATLMEEEENGVAVMFVGESDGAGKRYSRIVVIVEWNFSIVDTHGRGEYL